MEFDLLVRLPFTTRKFLSTVRYSVGRRKKTRFVCFSVESVSLPAATQSLTQRPEKVPSNQNKHDSFVVSIRRRYSSIVSFHSVFIRIWVAAPQARKGVLDPQRPFVINNTAGCNVVLQAGNEKSASLRMQRGISMKSSRQS